MYNRSIEIKSVIRTAILISVIFICMIASIGQVDAATYYESESNDYIGSADIVDMSGTSTYEGSLTDFDDVDYIKFTLTQGSEVNIDVYGDRPQNISKFGSSIILTFRKDDYDKTSFDYFDAKYNSLMGYICENKNIYLSEGTYYISLKEEFLDEKINYKISFNVTPFENFSEPNDYLGQATKVVDGKNYCGVLESHNTFITHDNESDFFEVTAAAAGEYYLTIKNINIESNFCLYSYDENGQSVKILGGKDYLCVSQGEKATLSVVLPKGKTYFRFGAYANSGKYEFTVIKKLSAPKSVSAALYGPDDVKVSWTAVSGATGYKVYYKKSSASTWKSLGTTKNTYLNKKDLSDGTKYVFRVIPYKKLSDGNYDGNYKDSNTVKTLKKLSAPKKAPAKLSGYDDVKFSWSKVTDASGYHVYYKKSGASKWTSLGTTTKTYVTKKNLADGKKYYFKVVPYMKWSGGNYYGNAKQTSIYTLKKVATPKAKKASDGKIKISWSGISGKSGYQIYKMKKSNGSYKKVTSYTTSKTYKSIKVSKGTKYYYKVRAYKTVDGKKVYGPWSKIKAYKR